MKKREPTKRVAQGLLAAGILLVAISAYNLTIGDELAGSKQQAAAEVVPIKVSDSAVSTGDLKVGQVFAKLYAPRLATNYVREIAQGTSLDKVLNTIGIGHYQNTQMPGEVGNFALAGHRAGNGGPFRNIDKFVAGDEIIVETATKRFTYRYLESKVVAPNDLNVIGAQPSELTQKSESGKYLTLTSCTPIYVNTNRIIVWFEQVEEQDR